MSSGIYAICNKNTRRCYVGSSKEIEARFTRHVRELRNREHHNFRLQQAWNVSGEAAFEFIIISYCSPDILHAVEEGYLEEYADELYNINPYASGGDLLTNHPNRDDIISRITSSVRLCVKSLSDEERRARWSRPGQKNGMYGKTHTQEVRDANSELHRGNKYCLGVKRSDEQRSLLSEMAKQRTGEKNPFFGKKHTDELRAKLRERMLGKQNPSCWRPVEIDGTRHGSLSEATRNTGISTPLIAFRIASKNPRFAGYRYLD